MPEATDSKPAVLFRVISFGLLLWGLGGASIYVAYFLESPEQFARTAETADNRQAYADYIADIPSWAITVGIIAAVARLLGAVALVLRRAWALPMYIVSLVFFLAALYRAFILADVARVMSGSHIAVEGVFLGLSVFAIWFAHKSRLQRILR